VHHDGANRRYRRQHKRRLLPQNFAVVKKCRSANYFVTFAAAKSIDACGKSSVFTVEE
jgi:hypothetical protein